MKSATTIFLAYLMFVFPTQLPAQNTEQEWPIVKFDLRGAQADISIGLYNLSQSRLGGELISWNLYQKGVFAVADWPIDGEILKIEVQPVFCENCDRNAIVGAPYLELDAVGNAVFVGLKFCPDCAWVEPLPECEEELKRQGFSGFAMSATPAVFAEFIGNGPIELTGEPIFVVGRYRDEDLVGSTEREVEEFSDDLASDFCPTCGDVDPLPEGCDDEE